jgi:hypothetical protein
MANTNNNSPSSSNPVASSPTLDNNLGPPLNAQIYYFKVGSADGRRWEVGNVTAQIASTPFASGAFRDAYRARIITRRGTFDSVVKHSKKPSTADLYFLDCATQMYSKHWAELYNSQLKPPKPVHFIDSFVLHVLPQATEESTAAATPSSSTSSSSSSSKELHRSFPGKLYSGEPYIAGQYIKHSDNFGWVNTDAARGTPHAFSHFTYEASNRQLVIVDMQGVNDFYTDPQIHTLDRNAFGDGNLGFAGLWTFLETHECTSVCEAVGLFPLQRPWLTDGDAKPAQEQQQQQQDAQARRNAAARIQTEVLTSNDTGERLRRQRLIELARQTFAGPLPERELIPPTMDLVPNRREIFVKQPSDMPAGWELKWNEEVGRYYFVNHIGKGSAVSVVKRKREREKERKRKREREREKEKEKEKGKKKKRIKRQTNHIFI